MNQITKMILVSCLAGAFALGCRALSIPMGAPQSPESNATFPVSPKTEAPSVAVPNSTPLISTLPVPPSTSAPPLPTTASTEKGGQTASLTYAVVLVAEDDVLNVRRQPGAEAEIVTELPYNATGITQTGAESMVGDQRWVEIRTSDGTGWVNANFLTEFKDPAEFCADPQVKTLIDDLRTAVRNKEGDRLAALVSPSHGLNVNEFHTGNRVHFSPQEASTLFESDVPVNWGTHPASGMEVSGTFRDEVLPKLDEVLNNKFEALCNEPGMGPNNYIFQWPADYKNINFMSFTKPGSPDIELDWRTWLVGIEYVEGKPYLIALIQLFWEP